MFIRLILFSRLAINILGQWPCNFFNFFTCMQHIHTNISKTTIFLNYKIIRLTRFLYVGHHQSQWNTGNLQKLLMFGLMVYYCGKSCLMVVFLIRSLKITRLDSEKNILRLFKSIDFWSKWLISFWQEYHKQQVFFL